MTEIVVAKPDRSAVVIAGAVLVSFVGVGTASAFWPVRLALVALAMAIVYRLTRMKLAVTPSSVIVQNYNSRHELPIRTVRISAENDRLAWPRDDIGALDATAAPTPTPPNGRGLYLMDDSGQRVRVRLAPVYGSRLDTIAEDLYRAIAKMRAETD